MTKRTDIHRPSAIVPSEYEFVACGYLRMDNLGDALYAQEERRKFRVHRERTGGTFSNHEHGGNCDVCGAACIWDLIFWHGATNNYIRVGSDCANKFDMGHDAAFKSFKKLAEAGLKVRAGKLKAQQTLVDAGLGACWEIYTAQVPERGFPYEERVIRDMVSRLVQYGSISEKTTAYAKALLDKIPARAAIEEKRAEEKAAAAPCPIGRTVVTGTVLKSEWRDNGFGGCRKMLVKDDRGFLVWSTVPTGAASDRGERLSFRATLTPSNDDPKFGFASRPSFLAQLEVAA